MMEARMYEKWALLEQSGELSAEKRCLLDECKEAQALRKDLKIIGGSIVSVDEEPSAWVATRIHSRIQEERKPFLLSHRVWQPILALAACVMLVVGVWEFNSSTYYDETPLGTLNSVFEEDLMELDSIIFSVSGSFLDEI